ncbi:MAG TPA: RluA family pseudouridine synthase [Phycisphaeraceae bacterium]
MIHQTIQVDAQGQGQRLDRLLGQALGASRQQVQRLLERGLVRVNGRRVSGRAKGRRVEAGDRVEVDAFEPPSSELILPDAHLPMTQVASGQGWLIVDKPAGMAVHPLRPGERGTVLNAIAARYPQVQGVGEGGLRSGVVHRLDVTTSGVLCVALDQTYWQRLREAFANHEIEKHYLAIVRSSIEDSGRCETYLAVTRHRPARVRVVEPGQVRQARRCALTWRTVERFDGATLIDVSLETGFLHQIRAMMAHLGYPVWGDRTYGGEQMIGCLAPPARPMLHALSLDWREVHGRCEPPADFQQALHLLRGK